jgi:hypothetical protein
MSFEAPLISILGRTRYDLDSCIINGRSVSNWNKIKKKLCLTDHEQSTLFKLFKTKYNLSLKEKSTCLESNKNLDSITFNSFMREFIETYKMCNKCGNPELCDYICNACGFSTNNITVVTNEVTTVQKKDKLTKQEKRANKIKAQQEKDSDQENDIESIIVENNTEL